MDELSDRFCEIPTDKAKEEEIDQAITNANQFYFFKNSRKG